MKISFNPSNSNKNILDLIKNNKDIIFDLKGHSIFARGVEFKGTDTNTWRDIKINNVSIGSHTLDLRNGSNTTLTNTNGVVTINSTWRPVVDNLTSDSTTSSLSAKQGKVLKALIDGKSNSDHNHDGRYLRLSGQDTMQGNLYLHSHGTSYIGKGLGDKSGADFTEANIVIRSWWGISFKSYDDIVRTYIDTRTGNIGTKGVLNAVGAVIQGRVYNGGDDEGIIINPAPNGYAGLILGTHNGERSAFYLKKDNPFWRYNNGSTNLDIYHPKKSGTIALTSDIPNKDSWNYDDRYLKLTGGWMQGDINFGGDNKIHWARNTDTASISFKNDGDGDANSYMSFVTSDNGNEYFRWSHSSGSTNTEWMALRSDGLRVRGTKVSLEGHSHNDLYATKVHNHDGRYVRAFRTSNDNIDSDWGQSFKTFDPIPSGTPPEWNPNISILNIGENFNRRKQLAFIWNNDNIYYRRHLDGGFTNWRRLAFLDSKVADSDKLDGVHLNGIFTGFSYAQSRLTATIGTVSKTVNVTGSYPSIGGVTMNTIASYGNCMGMASLASSNSNPNNQTSWHHFINMSYNTESTNMWQTQFAIKAGTTEVWVRSRAGGSISDSSAWEAPWVRLARITDNIASATNADMVDGEHASSFVRAGHYESNDLNKLDTYSFIRSVDSNVSSTSPKGNTGWYNVIQLVHRNGASDGPSYIGQIALGMTTNTNDMFFRGKRTDPWKTVIHSGNYTEFINNYYWANVKISASSSTTTSPTVHTLTATRVCAGHNPGIDNSISCSNWFRSSGNTGWYNTTYYGGWYMSDTFWIRAHNGVGIYTSGQIYSSSSIRMSNILLEHTNEINNSANGCLYLNYRNSGNVSLCQGGGNVGIGTTTPSYKLDVNGQMRASGFHHSSVNSDNYILLAGGGYKSFGGDDSTPIFLGYLHLYNGDDGTISGSFPCLGYSVPFTYTRGGAYCLINIPNTSFQTFYIKAAIASVHYSGAGMGHWVGNHRGDGAWWLHCDAVGSNAVQVKGFHPANENNDSWWGGNPLYSGDGAAKIITVCLFGYVKFR